MRTAGVLLLLVLAGPQARVDDPATGSMSIPAGIAELQHAGRSGADLRSERIEVEVPGRGLDVRARTSYRLSRNKPQ